MEERWEIVQRVVAERGRQLVKYPFFEEVWRALEELNAPQAGGKPGGFLRLKAPTGAGKTEAVLAAYLHCSLRPPCPWYSVVYALPTRSLVHAMARRFSRALRAAGVWPATVTTNYGDVFALSPFLEGDVAVSTYDTLLYAFYGSISPGYHVLLPLSKVSGSMVVLDEVQLLQDAHWFGLTLLPHHVSALLRFGANVIVMSATLPTVLSEELTRFARGLAASEVREVEAREPPARGRLRVELREGALPEGDDLVRLLSENDLYPALIVVNTVEKAARIYRDILRSGLDAKTLLLHSRLRSGARKRVEELFEASDRAQREGDRLVIVATQVVEAGLDLDAQFLLTELSPADSLIQRLGRCARRRDGLAIVFADPAGGRYIYPRSLLERTLTAIEGREESLGGAVSSIEVAQEIIDSVYKQSVVEELRRSVSSLVDRVASFIGREFPSLIFTPYARQAARESPLIRLGLELTCLYATGGAYEELLEGRSVVLQAEQVQQNLVRLSAPDGRVPDCVLHATGESRFAIALSPQLRSGLVELTPRRIPPSQVATSVRGALHELLLLNPACYLISDGHELGVVRPYD